MDQLAIPVLLKNMTSFRSGISPFGTIDNLVGFSNDICLCIVTKKSDDVTDKQIIDIGFKCFFE